MGTSAHGWKIKQLSKVPNAIATDEAEIRWIFAAKEASVVHCTLPPKATSVATRLVGIHEIWYFIGGQGKIWLRKEAGAKWSEKEVRTGTCFELPAGVHFQYCSTGEDPLTFLCVTMPPFQSNELNIEAVEPYRKQR
jgi:mannose-6-phosphate isomerase-like protein (cupin superfamily)